MHVWAALTTASACLGRHCYFSFGVGDIYPNLYTLLVGPPATKKSTAISLATKLAQGVTNVNFAPDDTAGHRQGLIAAIENGSGQTINEALSSLPADKQLEFLAALDITQDSPDKHAIFVEAREWGSFIGQNNLDLVRFLIKLYDGDDYRYSLRKESHVLQRPLAAMLGATTPTDISILLPPEVVGQGLMSRIILVFDSRKYGRAFRPHLDAASAKEIKDTYHYLWHGCHGSIAESEGAFRLFDKLHDYVVKINDTRFVYYAERRPTHLVKLATILAACRRSQVIEEEDVSEAHYILTETEKGMPDALGEYGLSPVAKARQRLLEYIRHANSPIPLDLLWFTMQKDMRLAEFQQTIDSLLQSKRVSKVLTEDNKPMIVYREDRRDEIIDMFVSQEQ